MQPTRPPGYRACKLLSALAGLFLPIALSAQQAGTDPVRIMLLTGESSIYHDWQKSSPVIEQILAETGLFEIELVTAPPAGTTMPGFAPDWGRYAAVVMDYDVDDWPAAVKADFVDYMRAGGGLVLVHAADNAFPAWPEFNAMAGVGGWRGRNDTAGPKLRWRDGQQVLDSDPGAAMHPPQHDFRIVTRAPDHPVMRGLPEVWLQANDELYSQLRGPARNVTILATAMAEPALRSATGEHEPMLMAIRYGEGRVFHTTLGHVAPRDEAPIATIASVGFIVTLQRGTEWAATGDVTQAVPADFPGPDQVSLRELR
jgi:hypothetical protein